MNEYYLVLKQMKLAITHDWLTVPGGAEKVVKRWYDMYPDAPVHTTVFDSIKNRSYFRQLDRVVTSFMQKVPFSKKHYTKMLNLMPRAFEEFNLSDYDVVLLSSSFCAKRLITAPDSVHIAYIHSPMRYAWGQVLEYFVITPVEAQVCGRPVIALKKGGALDTVIAGKTAVFFEKQDCKSLCVAMTELEGMNWDSEFIRKHAEGFSNKHFDKVIADYIDEKWKARLKEIT